MHGESPVKSKALAARPAVIGVFLLSGAAGLIYQVVWSRELVLLFGNTSQAVTTIVTAFMIGLGLGGYIGGRLADRVKRPLRLYGLVELTLCVVALLIPILFRAYGEWFSNAYPTLSEHSQWLIVIRLVLALLAVAPATILMGATLPLLARRFTRNLESAGADLSELYSANTVGAVAGTVAAGFVFIEYLGLFHTSLIAVFFNAVAGLVALAFDRFQPSVPVAQPDVDDVEVESSRLDVLAPRWLILSAAFVSGFVALALEILWTRMLSEGSGSRIYVFVAILAVYLIGIAGGSSLFTRYNKPSRESPQMLGATLCAVGCLALTTIAIASLNGRSIFLNFAVLLPATVFMGYSFPLTGRLLMRSHDETGRSVGTLYAANTAGSIFGAFSAGFILAPLIGGNRAVVALSVCELLMGAALLATRSAVTTNSRRPVFSGAAVVVAVMAIIAASIDSPIMRTRTQNMLAEKWGADPSIRLTHSEDSLSTVDTVGGGKLGNRALYVNGVSMTAITVETKLMAYLSKSIRPDADRFLAVAFGMGGAYRAGLKVGMQTDVVELSPTVPKKMAEFYPDAEQYLNDPRGKIIISDGRNYVRLSREKYDALVVDPAPPLASAGSVVLYTDEFVKQAKERLNPGGTMMLWIPYDAPIGDWKAHMRTFRHNFTNATYITWNGGMFMFGSDGPLPFDEEHLTSGLSRPGVLSDLRDSVDSERDDVPGYVEEVLRHVWLTNDQIDRFTGDGPLITDDRPLSEYFLWRRATKDKGPMVDETILREESARILDEPKNN